MDAKFFEELSLDQWSQCRNQLITLSQDQKALADFIAEMSQKIPLAGEIWKAIRLNTAQNQKQEGEEKENNPNQDKLIEMSGDLNFFCFLYSLGKQAKIWE